MEFDSWSFDKTINEVFRLLPEEICPKDSIDSSPSRPLSGIEYLMESRPSSVQLLLQSTLVEVVGCFWAERPFETVFQSISGRLPQREGERKEK